MGPSRNFDWGDINGDGHTDFISSVADSFPNHTGGLWVQLGDGRRGFLSAGRLGDSGEGAVSLGEFNQDGRMDVARLTNGSEVDIYAGWGDGEFVYQQTLPMGVGPSGLTARDYNGDGRDDVAAPWSNWGETPYLSVRINETP